jgi:hypothetical protein
VLTLVALLVLPATVVRATGMVAPKSPQRNEQLLIDGEVAFERGDFPEAILKYRAAYYSFGTQERASYMGSIPVRRAMQAYEQQLAKEQEPNARRRLLRDQRELIDEFLDAVRSHEGAAEQVGLEDVAELEATGVTIDRELEGGQTPPEKPPVMPVDAEEPRIAVGNSGGSAPTPRAGPGTRPGGADPTKDGRRDWVGLGMVIGGSVVLGAGVGVSAGRWTIINQAEAEAERVRAGGQYTTDPIDQYIGAQHRDGLKYLVAGSVVAGVGLVTVVGGVIHLKVRRRGNGRTTAMRVAPLLGRGVGVVVHRRF